MQPSTFSVPATCTVCGKASASGISLGAGATNITIRNNTSRCGHCGAAAKTVDGTWSFPREASAAIKSLDPTALLRLQDLLSNSAEPESVVEQIADDPSLRDVFEVIAKYKEQSVAAKAIIALLKILVVLAVEQAALKVAGTASDPTLLQAGDDVIVVQNAETVVVETSGREAGSTVVSPGRNEGCWCGSGQKYKRCHLPSDRSSHQN